MWPPKRSIQPPIVGATKPATSSASENPAIANDSDQPRSAAISGIISTGG